MGGGGDFGEGGVIFGTPPSQKQTDGVWAGGRGGRGGAHKVYGESVEKWLFWLFSRESNGKKAFLGPFLAFLAIFGLFGQKPCFPYFFELLGIKKYRLILILVRLGCDFMSERIAKNRPFLGPGIFSDPFCTMFWHGTPQLCLERYIFSEM